jgi:hypothetical protein
MALDHLCLSLPATTKTLLYTVPKGASQTYITIQNRDTTASLAIGDDTVAAIGSADGGLKIPAAAGSAATSAVGQIQFWANSGDSIYGYASAAMASTCVILTSYVQTGSAS